MTDNERDKWLSLEDAELQRQCRVDTMRGTGPGGQKRNKTESAVRLVHIPSGVIVQNDITRSQHKNKQNALESLRLQIALQCRRPAPQQPVPLPTRKVDVLWIAHILDLLESLNYSLADTAKACNISTSRLGKELAKHPHLWEKVNKERTERGFPRLIRN